MDNKVLVISKPVYQNILPLVDFPQNKDVFNIDSSLESIMGEANVAAYILGKYGINVAYTGIIGNDEAGENFKNVLVNNNINVDFLETNFDLKTDVNYTIINTDKGGFSHIKVNNMKSDLTKFKYDFIPSYIVFDDKDFSGANAALNNYPDVPKIFYGKKPDKNAINMCKKADYIVCNINFASKITGLEIELKKPKTIVNLYQRLIDLYKGTWVITLGEYGVIYCNENNVKMIPAIDTNVVDRDKAGSIFFGTFAYSVIMNMGIENAVRLANVAASASLSVVGTTNGVMDLNELLKYKIVEEKIYQENLSLVEEKHVVENVDVLDTLESENTTNNV